MNFFGQQLAKTTAATSVRSHDSSLSTYFYFTWDSVRVSWHERMLLVLCLVGTKHKYLLSGFCSSRWLHNSDHHCTWRIGSQRKFGKIRCRRSETERHYSIVPTRMFSKRMRTTYSTITKQGEIIFPGGGGGMRLIATESFYRTQAY